MMFLIVSLHLSLAYTNCNIFKYVVPKAIFIKRDHQKHIFALMCHFKLDMEHGLALVFQENKLVKIGAEDIIL